ncbi:uncharacterized protein TOT_040000242 [Theileria orientalis strain Shintoku]|uniref:Calpain catalytic domain-containing protein n=1 Tax=Theileria orientalis strain Shintoku TaxID=869250 RepID=J4CDW7_THEOR|nr:uncharacterized protein TOT_040000242 [Theileria orientalis strain Shintoku]BAM41862.1 uncharacterized protein TOT_040000242 [Theileria orientalis strain Shintoku]|eukprot:XP_009692163.1 uncharacterized protein TOT_040000242 [Theileria orientalis strain Shintoku]
MNKRKNCDPPPSSDCGIRSVCEEDHAGGKMMEISESGTPKGTLEVMNSYFDGCFMPAWEHVIKYKHNTVYKSLNEVVNVDELWQDPNGLMELNTRQVKRYHCWIRYFDLCNNVQFFKGAPSSDRIRQGYVGDCSMVSSLSTLSEYEKLNDKVLSDKIKLIDLKRTVKKLRKLSYPESSIEYLNNYKLAIGVKVYFNGCARCLFVDDWVPIRKDKSLLCAHSSDPEELWVTLFEKANMRLYGNTYSIKGTNPGIDTYHYTGWLPEIIQLPPSQYKLSPDRINGIDYNRTQWDQKNDIANLEKLDLIWSAIMHNFNRNIVVCVGTNELYDVHRPDVDMDGISVSSGIVSCHAYSVLDVMHLELEGTDHKLLLLKNPWGKARSKLKLDPRVVKMLPHHKNGYDGNSDNGVFWIEWINVLKWFSHVYLSWNTKRFRFTKRICFNWKRNKHFINSLVPEDTYLSVHNPQLHITTRADNQSGSNDEAVASNRGNCDDDDDDYDEDEEYEEGSDDFVVFVMLVQNKKTMEDAMKYLALHTFMSDVPIMTPYSPAVNGVYNNSEVILVKLLVSKSGGSSEHNTLRYGKYNIIESGSEEVDLVMLMCNFMKKIEHDNIFTMFTFSNRKHRFKLLPTLTGKKDVTDNNLNNFVYDFKWSEYNCGMNPNEIWSFISNPHFRLKVKRDIDMILVLETDVVISVNLRLFFSRMATIRAVRTKQAHSSGDYRLHCCVIKARFTRGTYTLIPSNFDGSKGRFRFSVFHGGAGDAVEIHPIPYPYVKLGDIVKKNVPTCSEYTRDGGVCGSSNGGNSADREYKIDASSHYRTANGSMVLDGEGLIDGTVKFYQIPDLFNVTVARMTNDYFEFKVEEPTLVTIKIKVNSVNDNKFVLFSEHCVNYPVHSPGFCTASQMDLDTVVGGYDDDSGGLRFCDNVCCVKCGGPYGQFYPTDPNLFPGELKLGFEHSLFSDLNGGVSKNGRSPSASAQILFLRECVVNFTLVQLFPHVQYRLTSLNRHRFQTVFFITTSGAISA